MFNLESGHNLRPLPFAVQVHKQKAKFGKDLIIDLLYLIDNCLTHNLNLLGWTVNPFEMSSESSPMLMLDY